MTAWTELPVDERRKRARRMQGRPTKLTEEIAEKILEAIRGGQYLSTAARLNGVGPDTVYEWLKRGRGDHPDRPASALYARFARMVDEADAHAEVSVAGNLVILTRKNADAALRFLAIRYRERWAQDPEARMPDAPAPSVQVGLFVGGLPTDRPLAAILEANPRMIPSTLALIREVLPALRDVGPGVYTERVHDEPS